jgi:uncharacterized protein (TIGR02453 family)
MFSGFPPEGLAVLAALEAENTRAAFEANRRSYEEGLLEPAKAFVVALGEELRRFAPHVHADPRVNGSIFRVNRDTRFSRDKRPYKPHLDLFFWEGEGRSRECPGYFFRLRPRTLTLGAGMHHFEGVVLDRYRAAVADGRKGAALEQALAVARTVRGTQLGGAAYKRVPAGFDAAHERAGLLKHDGLFVFIEQPLPKAVASVRLVTFCARRYERTAPLVRWLREIV